MDIYIATDFGSSNSGCAYYVKGIDSPCLLHRRKGDYGKEETRFGIHVDFLKWLEFHIDDKGCDDEFRIKSDTGGLTDTENPNIVWRKKSLEAPLDDFFYFSNFKMRLYPNKNKMVGCNQNFITPEGKSGPIVSIELIIKIFLRLLKIDACQALTSSDGGGVYVNEKTDKIHWAVTIPSIWEEREKNIMSRIATSVYGEDVALLFEPHGALLYFINHGIEGESKIKEGNVSVVVDAGGGTTDLACIVEHGENGNYTFDSVKLPYGTCKAGNDIDNEFFIRLCELLVNESKTENKYKSGQPGNSNLVKTLIQKYWSEGENQTLRRSDFYASLRKIQIDRYDYKASALSFQFTKDYCRWLKNNGHEEIAQYLAKELLGVDIPTDFLDKCYKRIIFDDENSIVKTVERFLREVKVSYGKIDRIIMAGGLSFSSMLRDAMATFARGYGSKIYSCGVGNNAEYTAIERCSGAVVMGAAYQLANPKVMVYTAEKSIYYDVLHTEENLLDMYFRDLENFDYKSVLNPSKSSYDQTWLLKEKLKDYVKTHSYYKKTELINGYKRIYSLAPICVRGCPAVTFHYNLFPMNPTTRWVEFNIYESYNPIVLFEGDPDATKIKTFRVEFDHEVVSMKLEIDASLAQSGNAISIKILDDWGNIVRTDEIKANFKAGC